MARRRSLPAQLGSRQSLLPLMFLGLVLSPITKALSDGDLLLTAEGSGSAPDAPAAAAPALAAFEGDGPGGGAGAGAGAGVGAATAAASPALIQVRGVARPSPPPSLPQALEVTSVSASVSRTTANRSVSSRGPAAAPALAVPAAAGHGPESREALSHASSEQQQVVLAAEGATYLPVQRPSDWAGDWEGRAPSHAHAWRLNSTRVQHIEAECQDDYMKIRLGFNGSFHGLLYSSGYAYDPDCVYVNGSGRDYYEFYIHLNRCGTLGRNALQDGRGAPSKNFMWNTVTVQYNPLIEEDWDEHFKVTCEYGYDFWKTVTFPFLDVEVATGDPLLFTLSPPECYMEIRHGYGPQGQRVAGPVRVGDPLTLLIYMRARYDGFDLVVSDCAAHNGAHKRIQLIDQHGCPVDDKLISRFRGSWSEGGVFETQVFAYLKTFRFTGSPALYIECDVRMCHGRCPTQPCHWRNAKAVAKRSAAAAAAEAEAGARLRSENVSLFQSLRVLQEGEAEGEAEGGAGAHADGSWDARRAPGDAASVCFRMGPLAALTALGCAALAIVTAALAVSCCRLRRMRANKVPFDTRAFLTHKGRIN